jgi:SAM-dependent methyltransferase
MKNLVTKTGERVIPAAIKSKEEYLIYLRNLFPYKFAKEKIPKNSLILDAGCGEGYGADYLANNFKRIIGIDVDKNVIAHAVNKYGGKNCEFKLYDGKTIPFDNETFEAVISFQVLEHVKDDINYVSEIYRVLKKGGILLLTTPNKTNRLKPKQRPWNRFHLREYYPTELVNLLKIRFNEVNIQGIFGDEEINKMERERIGKIQMICAFDPLNWRRFIPEKFKPITINILKKIFRSNYLNKNAADFINKYTTDNFHVSKNNIDESLDLLAISKK